MASAGVVAAVKARFGATFAGYPVLDLNEGQQPPADGSPFWIVQFPVATEEQISIGAPGANVFREEGAIRIVLQVPRGAGVDAWLPIVDQAREHFRGKQFGGVSTWAPSPPVLDDRNDDGGYWALSSSIPYYADALG